MMHPAHYVVVKDRRRLASPDPSPPYPLSHRFEPRAVEKAESCVLYSLIAAESVLFFESNQ